ncbi:hypothetical protein [Pseudoalteromonas sp. OOF1S-7]|uniref:hypothetical protein n=1 Tax=Pseudoalteromonas sp. OOF1S-7 TaxID=2917757 RepID=UPI001EF5AF21|nr:hypothetical protein [Pseudoalteromonas sp. OOF1S-7]MCG7535065.1 hypothetical protein [Pseudoalteromonas sp. OOF1S-7]
MAIITYTSLSHIGKLNINERPNTQEQFDNLNELAHAFSPSPFDLIRLSMTQPLTSQYCAAYSLTAAAATLGLLPRNEEILLTSHEGCVRSATLKYDDNFTTLALKLYKLTRFDVEEIQNFFDVRSVPAEIEKGGSVPQRVTEVACKLGMNAELFVTKEAQSNFFKLAQDQIKLLGLSTSPEKVLAFMFGNGYTSAEPTMPIPKADELNLVLVQTPVKTLHWVALSSDGTYFDSLRNFQPGGRFGCVGSVWSSRPYVDTGVWITVSNSTMTDKVTPKLNVTSAFKYD